MIENIIEEIKASENVSKEIIQKAKKQYNEIIEEAYRKNIEIENSTKGEIFKLLKASEDKATLDAQEEVKKLTPEYEKKLMSLTKEAALKEKEAIDLVIKKVFQ